MEREQSHQLSGASAAMPKYQRPKTTTKVQPKPTKQVQLSPEQQSMGHHQRWE